MENYMEDLLKDFEGFKVYESETGGKNYQILFKDKYATYTIVIEDKAEGFYLTDFYREEIYTDGYTDTEDLFDYRWSTVEQRLMGWFKSSKWKHVCIAISLGVLKNYPMTRFMYKNKRFIYE